MTAGTKPLLEICVESFDDAMVAARAGADRIEYCSSLAVGGLTPTPGAMMRVRDIPVPCMVMIRPRPGDFVYSRSELDIMKREIAFARECGAAGVVFGVANQDGTLNHDALAELQAVTSGLQTTLHRVFDDTPDPFAALETAIGLGFDRILTSGQQATAPDGAGMIAKLVRIAGDRIVILPGCGINGDNAMSLLRETGVTELHASCKSVSGNDMAGRYANDRMAIDGAAARRLRAAMEVL